MATPLVINGVSYSYPDTGDQSWGAAASAWAAAVTSGMLQKAGGNFTLTADVNFGATYGLVAQYLKSGGSNISSTGRVRLNNTDSVSWRDSGNTADYALKPSTNGLLQYNSIDLVNLSATQTLTNKTITGTFTGNITGTASGNTTYTANNHGLVLSSSTNAMTVLAPDSSTSKVLVSGGTGADPAWGVAGIAGGGTGQVTQSAAFNALSPMTTLGDVIYGGASGTGTRLAGNATSTKKFLNQTGTGSVSAAPSWDALVAGDIPSLAASIITSGTLATARGGTNSDSSAATGIAHVSSGTWTYSSVVNADISSSAAIARSKIAAGTAHGVVSNDSSGLLTSIAPGTSGNVLKSDGTDWVSGSIGSFTSGYDAVIGSAAQVTAGVATFSTWSAALSAVSGTAGASILVLRGAWTENITVSSRLQIMGMGSGSRLTGTVTFDTGSDYSGMRGMRISSTITVNTGVTGVRVVDSWQAASQTLTDNGTGSYIEVITE